MRVDWGTKVKTRMKENVMGETVNGAFWCVDIKKFPNDCVNLKVDMENHH